MDQESTYRDDNGDLQTTTRTVVVHRRDFEQDLVRLVVERDSGWEAERLARHLAPRASLHLAVSEVRPRPGKLEAEFVSGVARTVSGEGMAVEEIAHDQLLNSLSLREVFQWLEDGEARGR